MCATAEVRIPPRAAFQHRDFRLYQSARLFSIVSTEMQSVAVAWQVYELTRKPVYLGYVGLAQFLPGILLFLVAGHAADRFDRRRVLLVSYAGYAIGSILLFTYTMRGISSVIPVYGILLFIGTIRAFSGPAGQSLMPQLVPEEYFQNAVAWGSSIFMVATVMGPAMGGLIYGWANGAVAVYVAATAMYVAAIVSVELMHVRTGRMEKKDVSLETLLVGFHYIWRKKVILGAISLDLFAVLLGGAVALLPVYAKEILHTGPWGLGLLRSAPAVGAMIMAVLLAFHPLRSRAGAIMLWCVAMYGFFTIVFGYSRTFAISLAALFTVGAADMVSVVVRATLVQMSTPPEMRGRVSAVNLLFVGASNEFGQFESGITAQWFGAVRAVVLGGVGTLVVVSLWAWKFPGLRKVDRLDAKLDA